MSSDMFIKRYKIILTTIGPLFIGSGHELMKKEWIYDKRRKTGFILDERKPFRYLKARNKIQSFENFMLKDSKKRMLEWAIDIGLYPADISKVMKYEVDCSGLGGANTDKGVQTFIKDGFGKPYVPGSSVKGAVRNILLAYFVKRDNIYAGDVRDTVNNQNMNGKVNKTFLKNEANKMEIKYFHKKNLPGTKSADMVNDIMSGVRISDSDPLEFDALTMCQKIDITCTDKENALSVVRECIAPDNTIELEMSIDTTQTRNIDAELIMKAVNEFLQNYNAEFLSHFKDEKLYAEDVIYLGGGVGYHSKTITGQVFSEMNNRVELTSKIIDGTINGKNRKRHQHFKDKAYGVSPHAVKLTEYDGYLEQFGACGIKIIEV